MKWRYDYIFFRNRKNTIQNLEENKILDEIIGNFLETLREKYSRRCFKVKLIESKKRAMHLTFKKNMGDSNNIRKKCWLKILMWCLSLLITFSPMGQVLLKWIIIILKVDVTSFKFVLSFSGLQTWLYFIVKYCQKYFGLLNNLIHFIFVRAILDCFLNFFTK